MALFILILEEKKLAKRGCPHVLPSKQIFTDINKCVMAIKAKETVKSIMF